MKFIFLLGISKKLKFSLTFPSYFESHDTPMIHPGTWKFLWKFHDIFHSMIQGGSWVYHWEIFINKIIFLWKFYEMLQKMIQGGSWEDHDKIRYTEKYYVIIMLYKFLGTDTIKLLNLKTKFNWILLFNITQRGSLWDDIFEWVRIWGGRSAIVGYLGPPEVRFTESRGIAYLGSERSIYALKKILSIWSVDRRLWCASDHLGPIF